MTTQTTTLHFVDGPMDGEETSYQGPSTDVVTVKGYDQGRYIRGADGRHYWKIDAPPMRPLPWSTELPKRKKPKILQKLLLIFLILLAIAFILWMWILEAVRKNYEQPLQRLPAWPTPALEVRRGVMVNGTNVVMPYGEEVTVRILGQLPNQEALPKQGNHIGDAYGIGRDLFVWVTPDGIGQWIDPQIQ